MAFETTERVTVTIDVRSKYSGDPARRIVLGMLTQVMQAYPEVLSADVLAAEEILRASR